MNAPKININNENKGKINLSMFQHGEMLLPKTRITKIEEINACREQPHNHDLMFFETRVDNYAQAAKEEGKTVKYIFENEPSQAVRNYLDSIGIKDVEVVKNV